MSKNIKPNRGTPPGGMTGYYENVGIAIQNTHSAHILGDLGPPDAAPGHTGTDGSFKGTQDGTDQASHGRPTGLGGTNAGVSATIMVNPGIDFHFGPNRESPPQGADDCERQRRLAEAANALRRLLGALGL